MSKKLKLISKLIDTKNLNKKEMLCIGQIIACLLTNHIHRYYSYEIKFNNYIKIFNQNKKKELEKNKKEKNTKKDETSETDDKSLKQDEDNNNDNDKDKEEEQTDETNNDNSDTNDEDKNKKKDNTLRIDEEQIQNILNLEVTYPSIIPVQTLNDIKMKEDEE